MTTSTHLDPLVAQAVELLTSSKDLLGDTVNFLILDKLEIRDTEDVTGDDLRLVIDVGKPQLDQLGISIEMLRAMIDGLTSPAGFIFQPKHLSSGFVVFERDDVKKQTLELNIAVPFVKSVEVRIWDRDWESNDDILLKETIAPGEPGVVESSGGTWIWSDSDYRLLYRVQSVPLGLLPGRDTEERPPDEPNWLEEQVGKLPVVGGMAATTSDPRVRVGRASRSRG